MSSSTNKATRPPFVIEAVSTKELLEACMDVRVEVFVVEQGFSVDDEMDEYEAISSSLLLSVTQDSPPPESTTSLNPSSTSTSNPENPKSKKPIGTVRFTPSIGKISRLAILSDYRQYGFGRELMVAVEKHALGHQAGDLTKSLREEGGKKVIRLMCHSQIQVVKFYERLGFRREGEEFDEEGAPHQKMIKDIDYPSKE